MSTRCTDNYFYSGGLKVASGQASVVIDGQARQVVCGRTKPKDGQVHVKDLPPDVAIQVGGVSLPLDPESMLGHAGRRGDAEALVAVVQSHGFYAAAPFLQNLSDEGLDLRHLAAGLGVSIDEGGVDGVRDRLRQALGERALAESPNREFAVTFDPALAVVVGSSHATPFEPLDSSFGERVAEIAASTAAFTSQVSADDPVDLSESHASTLLSFAPVFAKQATITGRLAQEVEMVETVLADGTRETVNEATPGDFVVTNPGGERYVITAETFAKRYEPTGEPGVFRAKGMVRGFKNPTGAEITVVAPWGEVMHGGPNCVIVAVYDPAHPDEISSDRYIVGGGEFAQTYRPN